MVNTPRAASGSRSDTLGDTTVNRFRSARDRAPLNSVVALAHTPVTISNASTRDGSQIRRAQPAGRTAAAVGPRCKPPRAWAYGTPVAFFSNLNPMGGSDAQTTSSPTARVRHGRYFCYGAY